MSSGTTYGQFPHLLQHGFDLSIQPALSIIVSDRISEISLNVTEFLVALFCELALYTDHSFKRRIEVRNAQAEKLRKFCDELVIEDIEDFFCLVVFLLSPWELCGIVTWFCERFV